MQQEERLYLYSLTDLASETDVAPVPWEQGEGKSPAPPDFKVLGTARTSSPLSLDH